MQCECWSNKANYEIELGINEKVTLRPRVGIDIGALSSVEGSIEEIGLKEKTHCSTVIGLSLADVGVAFCSPI